MILQIAEYVASPRKLLIVIVFQFIQIPCLAADTDVPKEVIAKFTVLFPNAGQVEWTKKRSSFRADFIYDNCTVSLTFNATGEIIRGTHEIKSGQLPALIITYLQEKYTAYKALVVLEEYNHGRLAYEVELIKGRFHYILKFNNKGRLLNQYEVDKVNVDNTIIN